MDIDVGMSWREPLREQQLELSSGVLSRLVSRCDTSMLQVHALIMLEWAGAIRLVISGIAVAYLLRDSKGW